MNSRFTPSGLITKDFVSLIIYAATTMSAMTIQRFRFLALAMIACVARGDVDRWSLCRRSRFRYGSAPAGRPVSRRDVAGQKLLLSLDAGPVVAQLPRQRRIADRTPKPYGGWESPTSELRGHTLGHYLSACSMMYASTGDPESQTRVDYIVAGLAECQSNAPVRAAISMEGYLSAFPRIIH